MQTAKPLGNGGPDYSYGYGRVDVKKAIDFIIDGNNVIEDSIIDQNDKDTFYIDVPIGQRELLVTLVWDDFPGDPSAAKALVNDLDLIVKDPNGRRYYPWTLDPNNPERRAVRTQEDHTNNVEQVWVCNPSSGTWTIEVYGFGIPESPQTYSLVYSWSEIAEHSSRIFSIKNSSDEPVTWFDDCGNCWIEGILAEQSSHQPEIYHDEFIFEDSNGCYYMIIDASDGNMYIYGELYDEYEQMLEDSPQTNEFIIKDDLGEIVVLIGDDYGDLYLKGKFLGQVE
ncbi:MAG: hypothetical protein NTX52_11895 [Planctomycetota bacterium]|nr:hypothetical protein [Planctomycetota bacterium]